MIGKDYVKKASSGRVLDWVNIKPLREKNVWFFKHIFFIVTQIVAKRM